MIRFSNMKLDGDTLVETESREISQSVIRACPHFILVADHYRADGTCRCDDPSAKIMRKWGYRWDRKKKQWI